MKGIADILRGLGEPAPAPFAPAPFQQAALDALGRGDVLVSAPTGSGKTWIAEQEIARLLAPVEPAGGPWSGGPRVWYTTPLKALSNQKFRRFQAMYGDNRVGLLTGERRLNAHAPVVVATTEILRNALYGDAERRAVPDVIVLDEAHYLADPERGTAWEEILLLADPATRLLLLSATIPNAADLANWMSSARGRRPEVITLERRPVPLAYLFADGEGRLHPPDPRAIRTRRRHLQWLHPITDGLLRYRLAPAILFFPSRRECDDAARQLASRVTPGEPERARHIDEWLHRVPQLRGHPLLPGLRRAGVAAHHAGHLTAWRMCVEELLEAGLVRFVCATTTLAAGLDVPARTVVLSTLHRHGPEGPEPLTATEFHQMTGRAGRRGRDTLGITVIVAAVPDDADEGLALADAAPEPIRSAFAPSDAQVLNLLARTSPENAESLVRRSFAAYTRAPEVAAVRRHLAALPQDALMERPCGDRVATRHRFDDILRRLRRARHGQDAGAELTQLGDDLITMPCTGCRVTERCLATLAERRAVEQERQTLLREIAALEDREVQVFRRRAGVLRARGYLDAEWRPTAWGRVAARIRHPRMIVLAEALRAGMLPAEPVALAAIGGALGTERPAPARGRAGRGYSPASGPRRYGSRRPQELAGRFPLTQPPAGARAALLGLRRIVARLNEDLREAGLPPDPLEAEFTAQAHDAPAALWRATVIAGWASGRPWGDVVRAFDIPEGDMQRLAWQAAEILMQIEDVPDTALADPAHAGREAILRTPVEQ
ncbi:MAG TPA: DEAD/DEAH box helicase [bacterium]|nr:DEAD/DEAH box helicase [bacterium]